MSIDDEKCQRDVCPVHKQFEREIFGDFKEIKEKLNSLDGRINDLVTGINASVVPVAELKLRVNFLERVVYGAVALGLSGVGLAVLSLVIQK